MQTNKKQNNILTKYERFRKIIKNQQKLLPTQNQSNQQNKFIGKQWISLQKKQSFTSSLDCLQYSQFGLQQLSKSSPTNKYTRLIELNCHKNYQKRNKTFTNSFDFKNRIFTRPVQMQMRERLKSQGIVMDNRKRVKNGQNKSFYQNYLDVEHNFICNKNQKIKRNCLSLKNSDKQKKQSNFSSPILRKSIKIKSPMSVFLNENQTERNQDIINDIDLIVYKRPINLLSCFQQEVRVKQERVENKQLKYQKSKEIKQLMVKNVQKDIKNQMKLLKQNKFRMKNNQNNQLLDRNLSKTRNSHFFSTIFKKTNEDIKKISPNKLITVLKSINQKQKLNPQNHCSDALEPWKIDDDNILFQQY